jgi:hypothetical protein
MTRILFMLAALTPVALAQTAPTDAEITAAHETCNKPEHLVPVGSIGNRPPNAGHYKPEWASCVAIDAEYDKRQLAQKAKDAADQAAVAATIKKLPISK